MMTMTMTTFTVYEFYDVDRRALCPFYFRLFDPRGYLERGLVNVGDDCRRRRRRRQVTAWPWQSRTCVKCPGVSDIERREATREEYDRGPKRPYTRI